jgi:hypothetical protein
MIAETHLTDGCVHVSSRTVYGSIHQDREVTGTLTA